jgi:hypothetical protein
MESALDEIPARLAEEIALRAYDDKYVDRNEEREILQIAIQLGMRLDVARATLAQVCDREGHVLESQALRHVSEKLAALLDQRGRLDEPAFAGLLADAKALLGHKRGDRETKALLVQLLEERGPPAVKVGWFRNWYAAMKRELGLV